MLARVIFASHFCFQRKAARKSSKSARTLATVSESRHRRLRAGDQAMMDHKWNDRHVHGRPLNGLISSGTSSYHMYTVDSSVLAESRDLSFADFLAFKFAAACCPPYAAAEAACSPNAPLQWQSV